MLLAGGGEPWEASALRDLDRAGVVVTKRCVDLHELLATAATGTADVAVVAGTLPGLDGDAVSRLARAEVRTVAVTDEPAEPLLRLGILAVVGPGDTDLLADVARQVLLEEPAAEPAPAPSPGGAAGRTGRVLAVHGPAGAPGRTTVAIALAALHADSGAPTVLLDADPWGGVVAQHLGILDEVSGLLAAARLVNSGAFDHDSFARCRRKVADGLEVLTGLPRPDRWIEVRDGALEAVLEHAAGLGDVVVDTGFSLETTDDLRSGRSLGRNQMTLETLARADEVLVVGSAEPPALARLARTLVDLREVTRSPVRVVVNRMRDSLGWSRRDIVGMVEGYVRPLGVHFLPDDRLTTDRALVAGRSVVEGPDSALRKALTGVHDAIWGQELRRTG